ncbi:MAG: hypothetical protein RJB65_512 [Actinomycetota bacterium]
MTTHPTTHETDHQIASRLAVEAGRLLMAVRHELGSAGAPTWQVMDTGDMASHQYLVRAISELFPDDAILSEEGVEDPRRFSADRVWIVDPLDGTREFGEPGRHDWAVHVALWEKGHLTAGAVSLPALDMVFATDPAHTLTPPRQGRPRIVTSRTRNPPAAVMVARALDCEVVMLGSAGAKAMAVLLGEADMYVHDGGMYQWDSAAPAIVAEAAGLHVCRIDGSPIVYNERDPWLPDFIVCRKEFAQPIMDALWGPGHVPPAR